MTEVRPDLRYLLELRDTIGPHYGSEDLCVMLYSLVKREKPRCVVELGTGLGVTSAWIAAAMRENGFGTIVTVDNGEHFEAAPPLGVRYPLPPNLQELGDLDYESLLGRIFERAGVAANVKFVRRDIDLGDLCWLDACLGELDEDGSPAPIDIVFSDYSHAPAMVARIVAGFLPRLAEVGSIFVDSASTHLASYHLLEYMTAMLQRGRVPKELLEQLGDERLRKLLAERVAGSEFRLMHLVEKVARKQNSTAWLRVERASLVPALAIALH